MFATTLNENPAINFDPSTDLKVFAAYNEDLREYIAAVEKFPRELASQARAFYLNKLQDKWQPTLGFNADQIKADIDYIQFPPIYSKTEFTVQDAINNQEAGTAWLVPGLLPRVGLQLLGGSPKVGKSVLVYSLIYSVAVSGEFLGLPVKKGKVLLIQAEEGETLCMSRLQESGFSSLESLEQINSLDVTILKSFSLKNDLAKLATRLSREEYQLVVIDSLRKVTADEPVSENSADFGKGVYALQRVINEVGCAGILIHHLRKTGASDKVKSPGDIVERFSGSSAITSAPDGLMALFHSVVDGVPAVTLHTLPREGIPISINYTKGVTEEGLWDLRCLDSTSLIGQSDISIKILRILYNAEDNTMQLMDIFKGLGVPFSDDDTHAIIRYLQSLKIIITKTERKGDKKVRYLTLAPDNTWLLSVSISATVADANTFSNVHTRDDLRALVKDWEKDRAEKAISAMSASEQQRVRRIMSTPMYSVGDVVIYENEKCVVETVTPGNIKTTSYTLDLFNGEILEQELRADVY